MVVAMALAGDGTIDQKITNIAIALFWVASDPPKLK